MKVLDFGSLNFDQVYAVDHIIQPGETMDSFSLTTNFGGKGLNQAIAMAQAGVPVYMAGMVGEDGEPFFELCRKYGVDTTYLKQVEGKNGHANIQVDKNGQNCIILYGGSNRKITKEFVDEVFSGFEKGDIIVLQNEINELAYIIDKAYEIGMTIILNPSPYDSHLDECDMGKISIFLLNEVEGKQVSGGEEDPDKIIEGILAKYPDAKVVLTLGGDGSVYADKNQKIAQPIYKVKAVDTTAAGDTYTGFFIAGLVKGMPAAQQLSLAAKAAAIGVTRPGAVPSIPTMEEVVNTEL